MEYCSFEDSEIIDVIDQDESIEIKFKANIGNEKSVEAFLSLVTPKAKKLPKPGKLTDGEIYGIAGKPLDGKVPFPFVGKGDFEVELSVEDKSVTIFCKEIRFVQTS